MGLDMYLNARRYMVNGLDAASEALGEAYPELKGKNIKAVLSEAIYWRKANAIHQWFVENVQENVDNCGEYWVPRKTLGELRDLIIQVLETRDHSLLPPQAGFFFGSTEVDEYYFEELERTLQELDNVLDPNVYDLLWEFYYESSW